MQSRCQNTKQRDAIKGCKGILQRQTHQRDSSVHQQPQRPGQHETLYKEALPASVSIGSKSIFKTEKDMMTFWDKHKLRQLMIITSALETMFKVRDTMNKGGENSLNHKHTEKRINSMRGIHEQGNFWN